MRIPSHVASSLILIMSGPIYPISPKKLFEGAWIRNFTNFTWLYLREYWELDTKIFGGFVS